MEYIDLFFLHIFLLVGRSTGPIFYRLCRPFPQLYTSASILLSPLQHFQARVPPQVSFLGWKLSKLFILIELYFFFSPKVLDAVGRDACLPSLLPVPQRDPRPSTGSTRKWHGNRRCLPFLLSFTGNLNNFGLDYYFFSSFWNTILILNLVYRFNNSLQYILTCLIALRLEGAITLNLLYCHKDIYYLFVKGVAELRNVLLCVSQVRAARQPAPFGSH